MLKSLFTELIVALGAMVLVVEKCWHSDYWHSMVDRVMNIEALVLVLTVTKLVPVASVNVTLRCNAAAYLHVG